MKTRLVVVGFGFMGQTHAGNILKLPDAELAAIVDPHPPLERLASIKGNRETVTLRPGDLDGIPHYTDMETAFREQSPDACVIALPSGLHYSGVMAALRRGMHVFCEKPFSVISSECDDMVRAARKKNRILAVGHVVRLMPEYRMLRECVCSGRYGKPTFVFLSRMTGFPSWGDWTNPDFVRASGGALFDLLCHDIDFIRFCAGEPERIKADPVLSREFSGGLTSAMLHYPGFRVLLQGGFVTPSTFPFRRSFAAYFEHATLISDRPGEIKIADSHGVTERTFPDADPYCEEIRDFIRAVRTGCPDGITTGEDAAGTIRCCREIARQLEKAGQGAPIVGNPAQPQLT